MKLFSRTIKGDADNRLSFTILHGLYSSSTDWYQFAKLLSLKSRMDVHLLDLPNHGHSPWSDEFTYQSVVNTIDIDKPTILIGHSFGGRVAMALSAHNTEIKGVIILDISPFASVKRDRAVNLWHSMLLHKLVDAKKEGILDIASYLIDHNISADMANSMELAYRKMNLQVVADNVMSLTQDWIEYFDAISNSRITTLPTLFIRGGASIYVTDLSVSRLPEVFNNYEVATIADATHRLYQEKPEEVVNTILKYFPSEIIQD